MHELHELKNKLVAELERYGGKNELTASSLDTVDKLAHAAKNVCKIIDDMEYSETAGNMPSYDGRGGMYGVSYARNDGRGRAYARRDSMGRYSRTGNFAEELRELMADAPDEHTRKELERLAMKTENM